MSAARKPREPDPRETAEGLVRAVERGLAPAYLLRGEERWLRERVVGAVRAAAEARGLEVCAHDARDPDYSLARLVEDLRGGGLFGGERLVLAREVEDDAASKEGALAQAIAARLREGAPGSVVLSVTSLRADSAVAKAVQGAGGVVASFRKLYDSPPPWMPHADPRSSELVQWLVARARERGLRLDPGRALFVVAATGNDLGALDDQLTRIAAAGGDLGALSQEAAGSAWDVAESLALGDAARALARAETLFRHGYEDRRSGERKVDLGGIQALLSIALWSELRRDLAIAEEVERGAPPEEAARRAGAAGPPSIVRRQAERAAVRPTAAWRAMLEEWAALERRGRTGGSPPTVDDLAHLALAWRRT